MGHCEEGVVEDAGWLRPVLSADQQHALQQGHKLPPVSLLRLHIAGVKAQDQVHLMKPEQKVRPGPRVNWIVARGGWTHVCDVVEAAEDVFSGLFGFEPSLFLMLFCGLRNKRKQLPDGHLFTARFDISWFKSFSRLWQLNVKIYQHINRFYTISIMRGTAVQTALRKCVHEKNNGYS